MLAVIAIVTAAAAISGCEHETPSGRDVPSAPVTVPTPGAVTAPPTTSSTFVLPTDPATPPNRALEAQLAAEWEDRWESCMRDAGYEIHVGEDGGMTFDGDARAVEAQVAACSDAAGPEPTYAPMTLSEANQWYDMELTANACLAEHGVAVTEPPSREEYVETLLSQRSENGVLVTKKAWQAFDAVMDWTHWAKICPLPSLVPGAP